MSLKRILIIVMLLAAGTVQANENYNRSKYNNRFSVGFDLGKAYLNAKSTVPIGHSVNIAGSTIKNNLSTASLFVGYRWSSLGAQLGATRLQRVNYLASNTAVGTIRQSGANYYLDGIYFYPIARNLELKGIVGLGLLSTQMKGSLTGIGAANARLTNSYDYRTTSLGLRVGAGIQWAFACNWSTDLSVKFQVPGNKTYKNITWVNLALAYYL